MEPNSLDTSLSLAGLTLDELLRLAHRCDLIDSSDHVDGIVKLRLGTARLEFKEEEARLYLRGLIRAHLRTTGECR